MGEMRPQEVCVIGLGTVGLPTAIHISKYHKVTGYDIDSSKVENAKHYFFATTEWSKIPEADVYVICVNTWWRDGKADMSAVEDVCRKIAERASRQVLVNIESTVLVGTCRRIQEDIFKKQVQLANCPHRLWPADMERYGVKQLRILGAADKESMKNAKGFYQSIHVPVQQVSSLEASEMSKIVENSYRFIEIAYAEELALTCQKHGLDFNEIRQACNTLKRESEGWQVQIMEAKEGIGGTCLPKDIMYLYKICNPNSLIAGAIAIDDLYKKGREENNAK